MRFGGNGYWRYLTRATLAACAVLLIASASATAATRYAVATGGQTDGGCSAGSECTLDTAVQTTGPGDTVVLRAGRYEVTAPIAATGLRIVGAGVDTTVVVGAVSLAGPVLALDGSSTVSDVTVESRSAQPALDLSGTADTVKAFSAAGGAMVLRGSSDMASSVVHTSATGATALRMSVGLGTTTTVRHSTIVASGSGSRAIDATGTAGTASVNTSIANGVAWDVIGEAANFIVVSHSAYRRTGKSTYTTDGGGNVNGVATFVDVPNRDFQQDPTSNSVNAGDNSDSVAHDIAGRPRTIAEGTDIGAYELPIPPSATTGVATAVAATGAHVAGTVNPRGTSTSYTIAYGSTSPPTTVPASTAAGSGTGDVGAAADLTGLRPGTRYYYRVSATNAWGTTDGSVASFDTPSVAPTATAGTATNLVATGARLRGSATAGGAATSAKFEWGKTISYGSATSPQSLTGSDETTLTPVDLTGLDPATTYHFRVVATNANGTTESADGTFTTPARAPATALGAPSGVATTSATLNGSVDPGGAATTWRFEYGAGGYGQTATGGNLSGNGAQSVSRTLTGLLPGTSYSYRLKAENSEGTGATTGSFTTPVAQPTATTGGPSGVSAGGADLTGSLNPGGDAASYRFQYGRGGNYDRATAPIAVASGTDVVTASGHVSGLDPGTVYGYRLVVTNSAGTAYAGGATLTTAVARPAPATDRADDVTKTAARLVGTVNPGGGSTTWSFQYGPTTAYGHTTATATVTAGTDGQRVDTRVEDLEPGVVYHFRLVAHNAAGDSVSDDATFTTADPDPDPGSGDDGDDFDAPVAPVVSTGGGPVQADGLPAPTPTPAPGKSTNAAPAAGTIRVQVPGSNQFVELTAGAAIPVGTVVDATKGEITITSAADANGTPQTANFGGSQFKILQRRAAKPVTDIVMAGGDFTGCFPRALNARTADVFGAARRKWSRRRLWGNGHGRFRTRGRHGTATVRGTNWLTEDRCDGTLMRVKRGLVEVRDLDRRRTVMLSAGKQYFARSPEAKKVPRQR